MDQRRLAEDLANLAGKDWVCQVVSEPSVPTNITELLIDLGKIEVMARLGCDEKYTNGSASDFELLVEWERVLPLCAGLGEAAVYREALALLGLSDCRDPSALWKRGGELLRGGVPAAARLPFAERLNWNQFVSKFAIYLENGFPDLTETAIGEGEEECLKNKELHVVFDASDLEYEVPSPYRFKQARQQMISGEKLNSKECFVLCAQGLIELLLARGKRKELRTVLHLRDCDAARRLIGYLKEHRLFGGEVRLGVFPGADPWELRCACDPVRGAFTVFPEVILRTRELGCDCETSLRRWLSAYPLGGLRFGGCLVASPVSRAQLRVFARALASILADCCESETEAIHAASVFFESENL